MKRLLFLLMWLMASYAMAQDVIVMRDGTSILSKVLEITPTEVKYKKYSNLDGPTFTVLKTDILVINYENGEKETFETPENLPATAGSTTDLKSFSYEELGNLKEEAEIQKSLNSLNKKCKRIKIIGWTVGGLLVGAGLIMTIGGATTGGEIYNAQTGSYETYVEGGLIGAGVGLLIGGAAVTTGCLIRANKLKNKGVVSINSAPIYQHDFQLKNGNMLTAGVDVLSGNHLHEKTLGLGLRYSF